MSLWKDGLLLAAGGVAGLALASWLESDENLNTDGCGKNTDCLPQGNQKKDGMESLLAKVRHDAEWAMEECTTDEEREKVYDEVSNSIKELQATLQQRGEEIIGDLREQAMSDDADESEEDGENAVIQFKSRMEDLTKALNATLEDLKKKSKSGGHLKEKTDLCDKPLGNTFSVFDA